MVWFLCAFYTIWQQLKWTTEFNIMLYIVLIVNSHQFKLIVCATALLHAGQDVCFCLNGGFYSTSYPSCRCPPGFGGTFCENNYNFGE